MAAAFRLIRRTLLCLLIGVTAFGATGWGFRPKPNWSVETPGAFRLIVGSGHELSDDDPIWLDSDMHGAAAFRVSDGKLLHRIDPPDPKNPVATFYALPGGRLVLTPTSDPSRLFVFDLSSKNPISSVKLDGDWYICADSRHVWRFERSGHAYVFECRDGWTGERKRRCVFEKQFRADLEMEADYSAEADSIAVSERMRPGRIPPYGIELIDPKNGLVVKTVGKDAPESEGSGPQMHYFLPGGRDLRYELVGPPPFVVIPGSIELSTGKARSIDRASLPVQGKGPANLSLIVAPDGRQAWTLNCAQPLSTWISSADSTDGPSQWRMVPGNPIVEARVQKYGPAKIIGGAYCRPVPKRSAVIVRTLEESLSSNLPESIAGLVPISMLVRDRTTRHWWHDWESGTWRRVGYSGRLLDERPWPNALITLSENLDGNPLLQSWPLPPRDPKWPAAGIAVASAGGVWWMCAKRYARRMRTAA